MEAVVFTCAFAKPKTRIRVLQEPYEDLQHVYPVLRDSFFGSKFQKRCDELVIFDICEAGVRLVDDAPLGTGKVPYYLTVHYPEWQALIQVDSKASPRISDPLPFPLGHFV